MCGIAGFWDSGGGRSREELGRLASGMARALAHRGPDDEGVWADPETGIGLASRRLAILDLSPTGHQPMLSENGRHALVFNGEIYNHAEVRRLLERRGHRFRGRCDTEVVLAAFASWGVEQALPRLIGMFAFACWDRREQTLVLGRDRMGEKPLFYGWAGPRLLFASELKALHMHPDWQPEVDRDGVTLLLRYGYVPAPHSIYRGVFKVPAGHLIRWTRDLLQVTRAQAGRARCYWSARGAAERGLQRPWDGTEEAAVEQLETLLTEAIAGQMVADVPVGAFLSGGLDSATVVALMQKQAQQPVKTYTIGFREDAYNEASQAREVAAQLACEHTELYVSPADAMAVIPRLPLLYDEPLADASQIPTFLVAQLARPDVTVALSGDGGDELFGGYRQYVWGRDIWRWVRRLPLGLRRQIARALGAPTEARWNTWFQRLRLPRFEHMSAGDGVHRLAAVLRTTRCEELYKHLMSQWRDAGSVVLGAREPETVFDQAEEWLDGADFVRAMMLVDQLTRLPDSYLVKVDRASMGVSLECRTPFLDHRVVEFAWRVPLAMKVQGRVGKQLLRKLLRRHLPAALVDQPKRGFGIPLAEWLRRPELRDWVEAQLGEERLRREGYLNPEPVRRAWRAHRSGHHNCHNQLWPILTFQAWLEPLSTHASTAASRDGRIGDGRSRAAFS